jgi:hypothetical protein
MQSEGEDKKLNRKIRTWLRYILEIWEREIGEGRSIEVKRGQELRGSGRCQHLRIPY